MFILPDAFINGTYRIDEYAEAFFLSRQFTQIPMVALSVLFIWGLRIFWATSDTSDLSGARKVFQLQSLRNFFKIPHRTTKSLKNQG